MVSSSIAKSDVEEEDLSVQMNVHIRWVLCCFYLDTSKCYHVHSIELFPSLKEASQTKIVNKVTCTVSRTWFNQVFMKQAHSDHMQIRIQHHYTEMLYCP